MIYKEGDKIKIKEWERIIKEFPIYHYLDDQGDAITFDNGLAFSRGQYNHFIEKCPDLIDEIEHIQKKLEWYHLKNSKIIITKDVIEYEVINTKDCISDRFDILDL